MSERQPLRIHSYRKGILQTEMRPVVAEYPLRLTINGRPLATLIASPHQLNFLVLGFLRLQGIIADLEDIRCLGVCSEQGEARIELHGEAPQELRPVLTSGCGTGISFNLELPPEPPRLQPGVYPVSAVIELMRQLYDRSELYARHGGVHSAAVGGRDGRLLLHAEDIGRHNTLDRIAGEALFKGIDLRGCILASSGRISTEAVAKAARIGIGLIASRTSPTDAAVTLAEKAGICLIGYLRNDRFEVYCHPGQLALPQGAMIPATTGVILAGGESRRMGSDKSLLPLDGERFIERTYQLMANLFEEVLIVTNSPELYADIPCRKVPDIHHGKGALAGIHSGLWHATHPRIFVVACDMPFLDAGLIRHLCSENPQADVHIPRSRHSLEPLHARYGKNCLAAMERVLEQGGRRIIEFFPAVSVSELPAASWQRFDPEGLSFRNINTPQDYFSLRGASPRQLEQRRGSSAPD